ncbi:MAG: CDGSH iron-sulfur domain-containing protein [archaeon]|nr:CDGSH iron-sulfur domain-containing protein [archaeon]
MARIIVKENKGPMEIKVGEESKWIYMCGLSKNKPFCDGAHKKTLDEEEDKIYKYNEDGSREEISE